MPESASWLVLKDATLRNLRKVTLRIPKGRLVMVAGPSGAGKSTLFRDLLVPAAAYAIRRKLSRLSGRVFPMEDDFLQESSGEQPLFSELDGLDGFRAVIEVDQSPIGKTPRSTPATYLGIFDLIRKLYASLPESKVRGYSAGHFSFNLPGGRCETCQGAGQVRLEMAFMPDTYIHCDSCGGMRYGSDLLEIKWKGKSIGDILKMEFREAIVFFDFHSTLKEVCRLMVDCGLGYLTLGQSSPTLSGGEAQRLKLVSELAKGLESFADRKRGIRRRNLYLLEEPTIGLHLSDCEKLIWVLQSLVDQGHTVIVIEHNLDMLAEADYIVEMGPGGGPNGGKLIYQGDLAGLLKNRQSVTAPYLKAQLERGSLRPTSALRSLT